MRYADCHPERIHYGKGQCKPCYMRVYDDRNQERLAETARLRYRRNPKRYMEKNRKYLYGVSVEDYRAQVIGQAGRCLVCLRVPITNLVVDHDHKTRRVRGLLCRECNRALGDLQDDPSRARAAARYLERS